MTTTDSPSVDVGAIAPIGHDEAMALASVAYDRLVTAFEALGPQDWDLPTDCDGWTVRHLGGHVLGAMRSAASMRELLSQQIAVLRRARAEGVDPDVAMTAIQIERTEALTPAEVVAEMRRLVPAATRGRSRTPWAVRTGVRARVQMGAIDERWSIGYLVDVILNRDAWLHRVDLSRAVGVELELTADHDGRIVADVVAEWARRHGRPFRLTATGPAGGTFVAGTAGEELEVDAVELCRMLSGRAPGTGLLSTPVPF